MTWALENLKKWLFNWLLWPKYIYVWAKKSAEELCLMALKIDAKFKRKMTCAFKSDMRNLANMHKYGCNKWIAKTSKSSKLMTQSNCKRWSERVVSSLWPQFTKWIAKFNNLTLYTCLTESSLFSDLGMSKCPRKQSS